MRIKFFIISLFFFGIAFSSLAQLSVYPNSSAGALAQTIVGSGIQVSNAQLNCGSGHSATFVSSSTNLGISSGILLSTGSVNNAIGPNNDDGSGGGGSNCPSFNDPQLTSLVANATNDVCILQFDIIPACNTLNINYVFASEEYPEYVCSDFNDVFGFFLSGPNPAGGNYSNTNIALIPGTSTPVAINTINPGTPGSSSGGGVCTSLSYSNYYVNNSPGNTIQYDGFTHPLVANANVTPCATYHLKLAIADAGDCIYDSGVFLTYHGLTCPASQVPNVTASTTPVHCGNDGTASVNVTNYTGTPTYQWTPGSGTSSSITGLGPGTYTCVVSFLTPCPFTQTVTATISGTNVINSTMSSTSSTCGSPNGSATTTVSGGTGPYTYSWSTSPPQTTTTASGLTPGTYTVTITDNSGCVVTRTVSVANNIPAQTIQDSIVHTTCGQSNGAIFISNVIGGTQPYSYSWNSGQTTADISNVTAGNYTLTVTDNQNCTWTYSYGVPDVTTLPIDTSHTNERCNQANGTATIAVLQGVPPYTYVWNTTPSQNTSTATGLIAGSYTGTVTDAAGCNASAIFNVQNVNDVFNGSVVISPDEPMAGTNFTIQLLLPSIWRLDQSNWPDLSVTFRPDTTMNFPLYGNYDGSFWVTSVNGCHDTVTYTVFVKDYMTLYVPNAFTPNEDEQNDFFYAYGTLVKDFRMEIYDRWGNLIFESDSLDKGWDGSYKGKKVMNDVYVWKISATDFFDSTHKLIGHVTVVR